MADRIVGIPFERNGRMVPRHPNIERVMQKEIRQDWADNPALGRASFPRNEASIRHLHGRLQPSFDVEKHPRTVRVFADRTHQQVYVDAIEEVLDVKIKHPCVAPASLPRLADRIERRRPRARSRRYVVSAGCSESHREIVESATGCPWRDDILAAVSSRVLPRSYSVRASRISLTG